MEDVVERSETSKYNAPSKGGFGEKKQSSQSFQIRDAPWQLGDSAFPALSGNAKAQGPATAWRK